MSQKKAKRPTGIALHHVEQTWEPERVANEKCVRQEDRD